jgi:hypothetical protein
MMKRNRFFMLCLTITVPVLVSGQQGVSLKPGNSRVLTFTSGAAERGKQMLKIRVDQAGKYSIKLENDNPAWSGYWIVWDYIALKMNNKPIWEIGENESPPDFSEKASSEFCDPNQRTNCKTEFTAGLTKSADFAKDLNDGVRPVATVNFTLTTEHANKDLILVLSTLYATHTGAENFKMKVTLGKM